jgi:hypothetical protein
VRRLSAIAEPIDRDRRDLGGDAPVVNGVAWQRFDLLNRRAGGLKQVGNLGSQREVDARQRASRRA